MFQLSQDHRFFFFALFDDWIYGDGNDRGQTNCSITCRFKKMPVASCRIKGSMATGRDRAPRGRPVKHSTGDHTMDVALSNVLIRLQMELPRSVFPLETAGICQYGWHARAKGAFWVIIWYFQGNNRTSFVSCSLGGLLSRQPEKCFLMLFYLAMDSFGYVPCIDSQIFMRLSPWYCRGIAFKVNAKSPLNISLVLGSLKPDTTFP